MWTEEQREKYSARMKQIRAGTYVKETRAPTEKARVFSDEDIQWIMGLVDARRELRAELINLNKRRLEINRQLAHLSDVKIAEKFDVTAKQICNLVHGVRGQRT